MAKHTIMVVGGAGYMGSHMVKDLLQANYNVITLDEFSGLAVFAFGFILLSLEYVLLNKIKSKGESDI